MIDQQRFVERMLESENLTDDLEDDDANWLLNWGIGQIGNVIEVKQDLEAAAERVNALMQFMRLLNRIGGNPASISPKVIPELLERHSAAFGSSCTPSDMECQQFVETLPVMTSRQAMEFIINWVGHH
jgi:hypothetical protein